MKISGKSRYFFIFGTTIWGFSPFKHLITIYILKLDLQCWSEIIETNAKNGVVFDATSNEQPIKMTNPVGFKTSLLYL